MTLQFELFITCTSSVEKEQMLRVPAATFSGDLLHQSSIQIIYLQLPADINADCIFFPIVYLTLLANPFGENTANVPRPPDLAGS